MDVGVMLPVEGEAAGRQAILDAASAAEALGYHSVWVSDRMLKPIELPEGYPYSATRARTAFRRDRNWLDAVAVMGLVAGVTSQVKIGTHVLVLPYRNPIVLAQEAATLDALTGGRILLGIGIGWMEKEFAALGIPKKQRGDRADEYISIMRELWSHPDGASFRGRYFEFADMVLAARPCRPAGPPILIGGNSPAALERTARLGDGWAGVDLSPREAALVVNRLQKLCAQEGRSAEDQVISLKRRLTGPSATGEVIDSSPEEVIAEFLRYQQAGVDLLVLDVMGTPDQLAALNWIGQNVLPRL
jgi:probable F420-dependent oxidoreductase